MPHHKVLPYLISAKSEFELNAMSKTHKYERPWSSRNSTILTRWDCPLLVCVYFDEIKSIGWNWVIALMMPVEQWLSSVYMVCCLTELSPGRVECNLDFTLFLSPAILIINDSAHEDRSLGNSSWNWSREKGQERLKQFDWLLSHSIHTGLPYLEVKGVACFDSDRFSREREGRARVDSQGSASRE